VVQRFFTAGNEAKLRSNHTCAEPRGSWDGALSAALPSLGHTFAITLCATRKKSPRSGYLAQSDNRQELMSIDVRHAKLDTTAAPHGSFNQPGSLPG
jgi:hypothetical protein